MRLTRIECSKCSDIVETTATSMTFPFTCDACLEAQKFVEVIAPKAEPKETPDLARTLVEEDNHDTATVENTTLLIADLEQQLAGANREIAKMDNLLLASAKREDTLRKTITNDRFRIADLRSICQGLSQNLREVYNLEKFTSNQLAASKYLSKSLDDEIKAMRARGFWARVFNN